MGLQLETVYQLKTLEVERVVPIRCNGLRELVDCRCVDRKELTALNWRKAARSGKAPDRVEEKSAEEKSSAVTDDFERTSQIGDGRVRNGVGYERPNGSGDGAC